MEEHSGERARLEQLWAGEFGDSYVRRNIDAGRGRSQFWSQLLAEIDVESALEVGCNVGANLDALVGILGGEAVSGVDINGHAIEIARSQFPGADLRVASASDLPFADSTFDFVFTMGVLIHQPPSSLSDVMSEIVRCSRRYVLCGEYFAPTRTEVTYRGERGALFKDDFGTLYESRFPQLRLLNSGFLSRADGPWDDITFWLFEKHPT